MVKYYRSYKGGIFVTNNKVYTIDEIKNIVDAKGKVYAEVWYKVKVSHPFIKKENIKVSNVPTRIH